jgi:hypothetical protein
MLHNKISCWFHVAIFGVGMLFAAAIQTDAADDPAPPAGAAMASTTPADEWRPVGGVRPFTFIELPEEQMKSLPTLATARAPGARKMRAAATESTELVPGGGRYGYTWISGLAETDEKTAETLTALYNTLVDYAEGVHISGSCFAYDPDSPKYVTGGLADISSLKLPVDIVDGKIDSDGENTRASRALIQLAIAVFTNDNPQYWMFNNASVKYYGDDDETESLIYTKVCLSIDPDYKTPAARDAIKARVEAKYQEYAALADTVTNDQDPIKLARDKIQLVHDKMLAERDYSYVNGAPDDAPYAHNILGVMDTTTLGPVCEAFAEAFTYILNRLGVGNPITVIGMAGSGGGDGSGGHAWNLVQLGDDYYYVDSTWDNRDNLKPDSVNYDEGNRFNSLYYKYFLVGSGNTDFDAGNDRFATHWAAGITEESGNPYVLYGLPKNINPTDYTTPSAYSFLTANGHDGKNTQGETVTTADDYDYAIGKSATLSGTEIGSRVGNPLWVMTDATSAIMNRGPFTFTAEAGTTPKVPLYSWSFVSTGTNVNTMFPGTPIALKQGEDYTVEVEPGGEVDDTVRAWIYGTGTLWRGIDFVMVTLTESTNAAPPVITEHPQSAHYLTDVTGTTAEPLFVTASVSAGGILSYQWYKNTEPSNTDGTPINGEDSPSYTPSTEKSGTTYYYVVVTNTNDSVGGTQTAFATSNVATITVADAVNAERPTISSSQLQSAFYRTGTTASRLSVTATVSDGGTLSYQWHQNTEPSNTDGTPIVGEDSPSYTPSTKTSGTAYYYVVITNTNTNAAVTGTKSATATSDVATITVVNAPSTPGFTANLGPTTTVTGDGHTLSVTATSNGSLSYQWQMRTGNGEWQDVTAGANGNLLNLDALDDLGRAANGRQYRVTVTATNAGGAISPVYSATTTLQVFVHDFFDRDNEQPASLAFGGSGTLYVGTRPDSSQSGAVGGAIHRIILTGSTGGVEKIAGGNGWGHADATAAQNTAAKFGNISGVAVAGGALIVADYGDADADTAIGTGTGNFVLRRVDLATRAVTTIAGAAGQSGTTAGTGTNARFYQGPGAIAVASATATVVYVIDGHAIRKVTLAGAGAATVSAFAGDIIASGTVNDTGTSARFEFPECLAVDASGNLYVGESAGAIRKVTPAGVVTTFTGTDAGLSPAALAVDNVGDNVGDDGLLYVASSGSILASPLTGEDAGQFSPVFPVIAGAVAPAALPPGVAAAFSSAAAQTTLPAPVAFALDPADGSLVIASEDTTALLTLSSGSNPVLTPLLLAEPIVTATTPGTGGGTNPGGGGSSSGGGGGGGGGGAASLPALTLLAVLFAWRARKTPADMP